MPLAVVLAIALGGGIYWFLESQGIIKYPEFISKLLPWEEPTKDWNTYTNEDFGFSIGYPKDWDLIIDGEGSEWGFFFISPDQDLSAQEIADKKAIGYSPIALYRPMFAVLPAGGFGHGGPDQSQIKSVKAVTLKGRPFNITRYKNGYTIVAEKYDPNVDPEERSPFRIEFYPGSVTPLPSGFFDEMFATLKFLE